MFQTANLNPEVPDSLVDKIRKLLCLSANNPSREEAELALQKAQKIALEWEIDLATIDAFAPKKSEEPILKQEMDSFGLKKRLPISDKFVVYILMNHFKVRIIYSGGRYSGRQITFIGKKTDLEIANYLYGFLNRTFMELWKNYYYQNEKDIRLEERSSYFYGLYQGLNDKLEVSKKQTEEDKFQSIFQERGNEFSRSVQNQYALMVVSDKERLQNKVEEYYPNLRKTTRSWDNTGISKNAVSDGREHGKNISINRAVGASGQRQIQC